MYSLLWWLIKIRKSGEKKKKSHCFAKIAKRMCVFMGEKIRIQSKKATET